MATEKIEILEVL